MYINPKIFIPFLLMFFVISTRGNAQIDNLNPQEREELSYCYGVYATLKNKQEVQKNNQFLEKHGNTYASITNHPAYQKGTTEAKGLSKERKSACYMQIYGFLSVGYALSGEKEDPSALDLPYCVGYLNAAREYTDKELIAEFCSNELSADDCSREASKVITANRRYQQGRKEAKTVSALRVLICGEKVMVASEEELNAAFEQNGIMLSGKLTSGQNKAVTPKKKKDMITTPIFPPVKKKK